MKQYETFHLVKGEDLNHHGTLFAARAAAWFVESGFTAAACEHGNSDEIVFRNLHNMSFSAPMVKGAVAKFTSRVVYAGKTSLMVYVKAQNAMTQEAAVEGFLSFVTVDDKGVKRQHCVVLDEAADGQEQQQREAASRLRENRERRS